MDQKDENTGQRLLTIADVASHLAIKKSTLYAMVEREDVPHYHIGRLIRFAEHEISEWLKSLREAEASPPPRVHKGLRTVPDARQIVRRAVQKAIDGAKGRRYTGLGKPTGSRASRKEVKNGTV